MAELLSIIANTPWSLMIIFIGMALLLWRSQENNAALAKLLVPAPAVPTLSPVATHPVLLPYAPAPAPLPAPSKPIPVPAAVVVKDNFDDCMAFVWPEEGGFSNDPQDHGGPTNLGVTGPDLVRAGMPSSIDDIKALTKPVAAARIYRPFYWNAMHCDELPHGVDLCVFDLGINAGIHEAAKLLQRDVGTVTDGVIGPKTIAAAHAKVAADIIRTFTEERLGFYQSLRQFDRFGRDWTKRTNDCHAAALKMAMEAAAPAPLAKTA